MTPNCAVLLKASARPAIARRIGSGYASTLRQSVQYPSPPRPT